MTDTAVRSRAAGRHDAPPRRKRSSRRQLAPYLYVLPIVVVSGLFIYYCIGFTIYASLTSWDGLSPHMSFIGLDNYSRLLSDRIFWTATRNNLVFLVATVTLQAVVGLLLAVLLKARLFGSSFFKAAFFLPVAMTPVIIAGIFRILLDANVGNVNRTLGQLHLGFAEQTWLADPHWALASVIGVNIFEWMGFSMVIYYAGLMSIPEEIYEAARIDGAGWWQTLFRITVPQLRGTTNVLVILGIVGSLKTFDIVMLLTGGGPGASTEFLNTYLYKTGFQQFDGGYSAAIGVMILVFALVLSLSQLRLAGRHDR
jgi:raffinose/stachyose/melibiose transport system permease protein